MFECKKLKIKKGNILTKEMLQELDSFPHELLNIMYDRYSDGIIEGCDFFYDEAGNLSLSKGIIKFENNYYLSKKDIRLYDQMNQLIEGKKYYICAVKKSAHNDSNIKTAFFDIKFLDNHNGFCFASLLYRKKLPVKIEYDSFKKIDDNNYLNICYRILSSINEPTFSSKFVMTFAKDLAKKDNLPPICLNFISKVFNYEKISFEYIKFLVEKLAELMNTGLPTGKDMLVDSFKKILNYDFKDVNIDHNKNPDSKNSRSFDYGNGD